MIYFFIGSVLMSFALYCLLANILKIPSFKNAGNISKHTKANKVVKKPFSFLSTLSKPLSAYIKLNITRKTKLEFNLSNVSTETPEQYTARLIFTCAFILLFAIPLAFISWWLTIIPIIAAILAYIIIESELKDAAFKHHELIDEEIPRFVENFSHSIKTNRNVLTIFERYTQNYDTYLSKEILKTIADMRTGSQEIALQRFELRMNNTTLSQLTRGILATMHGEDMTIYFDELVFKMSAIRKQRLTAKALKIKPKISALSNIRAMWSICILIFIAMAGLASQYWK